MSFFTGSNPFASQVGQLIDKSTSPTTSEENVEMFFEICDIINSKEENAKDALKVIRKKLSTNGGKNWNVVIRTLKLLETCSYNCNRKFQVQLANKDFLQELKTIIGPKLQPPLIVQEKILYLIQNWTNMFKNDPEFKPIEQFYLELRSKGVDFPINDPESIYKRDENIGLSPEDLELSASQSIPKQATPKSDSLSGPTKVSRVGATSAAPHPRQQQQQHQQHSGHLSLPTESLIPGTAIRLNEEQIAKLNSELDIVDNNIIVMNEIINELQSSYNQAKKVIPQKDIDLVKEINRTCREMQKRITHLIGNISNENIINELLRINDDLNNVFLRYDRLRNNGNNFDEKIVETVVEKEVDKPLIDFGDTSKHSIDTQRASNSNNLSEIPLNEPIDDEDEIKEMEEWLKSQEGIKLNSENAAAESKNSSHTNPNGVESTQSNPRSLKTDENSLFAL